MQRGGRAEHLSLSLSLVFFFLGVLNAPHRFAPVEKILHWWKLNAVGQTNPCPRRQSPFLNGSIYLRWAPKEHGPAPHMQLQQKSIGILRTRDLIKTGALFLLCFEEMLTSRNHYSDRSSAIIRFGLVFVLGFCDGVDGRSLLAF